jgi:hypothetical protein
MNIKILFYKHFFLNLFITRLFVAPLALLAILSQSLWLISPPYELLQGLDHGNSPLIYTYFPSNQSHPILSISIILVPTSLIFVSNTSYVAVNIQSISNIDQLISNLELAHFSIHCLDPTCTCL